MSNREVRQQVATALAAAKDKKAEDVALLELPRDSSAFTDYFLICSGNNPRQVQAIADAVDEALSKQGSEPNNREGYDHAEWVLLDYVDFVVHIFSSQSRKFYDLERLWKSATQLTEEDLAHPPKKVAAKAAPAKHAAPAKKIPMKRTGAAARNGKSAGHKTSGRKHAGRKSAKASPRRGR